MIRKSTKTTVTIASGAAVSGELEMREASGGVVLMPAAWTAASIGFQVSDELHDSGGTFYPLKDDDGNLVQIDSPAVDEAYSIPAAVFAAARFRLWSQDGSGNNTNQGAERVLTVFLKS